MTLIELSNAVTAANTNWTGLSTAIRTEFSDKLRARVREAFDSSQRDWLSKWWLRCTQPQINGANALLPPRTRITGRRANDGLLYVSADLLTDCQPGERYAVIATNLRNLTMVRKQPSDWPAPTVTIP